MLQFILLYTMKIKMNKQKLTNNETNKRAAATEAALPRADIQNAKIVTLSASAVRISEKTLTRNKSVSL